MSKKGCISIYSVMPMPIFKTWKLTLMLAGKDFAKIDTVKITLRI